MFWDYVKLVADGTKEKPYCSFVNHCQWNSLTKQECAKAVCHASGYLEGHYYVHLKDPCKESITEKSN